MIIEAFILTPFISVPHTRFLCILIFLQYWVSQGNKWCDFCKIYIANNPSSIRTHEFGQRHKDSVAKRLADQRKSNALKEKEKQQALKDMDRIEAVRSEAYSCALHVVFIDVSLS